MIMWNYKPFNILEFRLFFNIGKGGKNRRKGKNDTEDKRELVFKEFGHGNKKDFFVVLLLNN